jgi:hypothetical protein
MAISRVHRGGSPTVFGRGVEPMTTPEMHRRSRYAPGGTANVACKHWRLWQSYLAGRFRSLAHIGAVLEVGLVWIHRVPLRWLDTDARACVTEMVRSTYNHRGCLVSFSQIVAHPLSEASKPRRCRSDPPAASRVSGAFSTLNILHHAADEVVRANRTVAPELPIAVETVQSIDRSSVAVHNDRRFFVCEGPNLTPSRRVRGDYPYLRRRANGMAH